LSIILHQIYVVVISTPLGYGR